MPNDDFERAVQGAAEEVYFALTSFAPAESDEKRRAIMAVQIASLVLARTFADAVGFAENPSDFVASVTDRVGELLDAQVAVNNLFTLKAEYSGD